VSPPRPTALITGASSGIGAEFARQLAPTHDLILVARRADRLEALAREWRGGDRRCDPLVADLATPAGCDAVAAALAANPAIELLVNNAGFGARGPFWELSYAEQRRMHALHVDATLRLSHAALAAFVPRRRGALINVASVAAYVRGPGSASYCATKSWMTALTEGLALDLRRAGSPVTVQALCPGFTYSEFHDVMGSRRGELAGRSLWLDAADVVADSLRGLRSGRVFVVPNWRYRLIVAVASRLPNGLRLAVERRRG
jgi:short-subunit dehydrogenase